MKVTQFLEIYKTKKSEEEKENFVKSHITRGYIPYNEKIAYCSKIVENSMYEKNNDKLVFKLNSPSKFLFTNLILIKLYSDLEIEIDQNPLEIFDSLNEKGLIFAFIKAIPETEYAEFQMLINMIQDDRMTNERDLVSYIDTKIEALSLGLNSFLEGLTELEDIKKYDNEIVEL